MERSDEASLGLVKGLLSIINEMCKSPYIHAMEITDRQNQVTQLFSEYEKATKSYLRLSVEGEGNNSKMLSKIAAHMLGMKQGDNTKHKDSTMQTATDPRTSQSKAHGGNTMFDDLLADDLLLGPEDAEKRASFFKSQYYSKPEQSGLNSKFVGSPTTRRIHNQFLQSATDSGLKPNISIGNGLADISFDNVLRPNKKVNVEVQTDWRMATLGSPNHGSSHKKKLSSQAKPSTNKKLQLIKSFYEVKPSISINYEGTPKKPNLSTVVTPPVPHTFYLNHKRHLQRPIEPLLFTPGSAQQGTPGSSKKIVKSSLTLKPSWVATTKILRMSSLDDRKRAPSPKESQLNLSKTDFTNLAPAQSERGSFVKGWSRIAATGRLSARSNSRASIQDKKSALYAPTTLSARGSTDKLLQDQFDPDSIHNPRLIANLYSGLVG